MHDNLECTIMTLTHIHIYIHTYILTQTNTAKTLLST